MFELVRTQALGPLDLRNDFVTLSLNAEAVHVIPTEHGGKVRAHFAHVHALRTELVAIENYFGLRLVKFHIGIGENEHTAGHRLLHDLSCQFAHLLRFGRGLNYEVNWERTSTRQWRRSQRNDPDARYFGQFPACLD